MPSPIHNAVAFRCAPRLALQASDFVRIHDDADGTLVFMNGSMHRGRAHVADSAARGAHQASPERVAEWLVDAGIREERRAYTAVAVLRLGLIEEP